MSGERKKEEERQNGKYGALTRCRVWSSHLPGERASHTPLGQGQTESDPGVGLSVTEREGDTESSEEEDDDEIIIIRNRALDSYL